jgi:signal peptidase I
MYPTVRDGEWVIIQRAALFQEWEPVHGDIIIIESAKENDVLIKRVIGVPGDTIELYDGVIHLNGRLYRDEFSHDAVDHVNYVIVPLHKDQYWVVGDNRGETIFGVVKLLEVSGRVVW